MTLKQTQVRVTLENILLIGKLSQNYFFPTLLLFVYCLGIGKKLEAIPGRCKSPVNDTPTTPSRTVVQGERTVSKLWSLTRLLYFTCWE